MKKSEALHILGLKEGSTDEQVKKAHREKVRINHPDRFIDPNQKAAAEDKTKLINEARDVLLKRKWDPEYGPRTGGYGNPYNNPYTTYRPGTSGTASAGGQGYAWPGGFGWTGTYTSGQPGSAGQGTGQGGQVDWSGIPFTYVWTWNDTDADGVLDPWETIFAGATRKTDAELLEEAKKRLSMDYKMMAGKLAMLLLCGLTGNLAVGMFTYALITLVYGFYRSQKGCGMILLLPFLMVLAPLAGLFAPRAGVQLTGGSIVFFGMALYYDIKNARQDRATLDALKSRMTG